MTNTTSENHRSVRLERTGERTFRATNERGDTLDLGQGEGMFTPVELLLAAMAGCSAIDVDILTSRRAEPTGFEVTAGGEKLRDRDGSHMGPIEVSFSVTFPEGPEGDAAREQLPKAVQRSHESICTVSRTVLLPTEVSTVVADD